MKNCPRCGAPWQVGDSFCEKCRLTWEEAGKYDPDKEERKRKVIEKDKAKFCINCGAKLQDNAKFCSECACEVGNVSKGTFLSEFLRLNSPDTNKRNWLISFFLNLGSIFFFWLTEIYVGVQSVGITLSVTTLFSREAREIFDSGSTFDSFYVIYMYVLIFYAVSILFALITPIRKKELKIEKLTFPIVMMSVLFLINVIIYFVVSNEVKGQSSGIVEFGLNGAGWIYVIVCIISIVHFCYVKSTLKKTL